MATKYHILELTSSSDIGGTEKMLINLLSGISRESFRVHVCSLIGSGKLTREAEKLDCKAETLDLRHPLQLRKIRELYLIMKRGKFDLVQTYGLRADTLGRFLGHLAKIPVIISSIRSPDPWRRWYHVLLDRATLRWADFFVSNSEAGRNSRIMREKYPPMNIQVIYNGIQPPPPYSLEEIDSLRKKYDVREGDHPVVAQVANLRVMKGHREVIRAIPGLKKKFPRILFLFAGRDDSRGKIERLAARARVLSSIRFLGYCPNPLEVLAVSDAFLLPSHWEGCPSSLLEAMAMKKPCIATRVGGIPEIIRDKENGLLIPPKNPKAIAGSIQFLFENPGEANKLAEASYQTILDKFSLKKMIDEYQRLYAELIEAKRTQ